MSEVNWYGDRVRLVIDDRIKGSIANVAARVEERTKINISEAPGAGGQGLIDTGFMINSVYFATEGDSGYADETGYHVDREGNRVWREMAPEAPLGEALALVAVGAEYAIYQEIEHGFFIRAIEDTADEIDGLIETF